MPKDKTYVNETLEKQSILNIHNQWSELKIDKIYVSDSLNINIFNNSILEKLSIDTNKKDVKILILKYVSNNMDKDYCINVYSKNKNEKKYLIDVDLYVQINFNKELKDLIMKNYNKGNFVKWNIYDVK